jgi:CRP-like cAMP-binding protein
MSAVSSADVTVGRSGPRAGPWPGWADSLAAIPFFGELPRRHLKKVADLAELRWYGDGKALARVGGPGDAFFALLKGRVVVQTPAGHTRALQAGDSFGELSLIDGRPRAATVVSEGGTTVARIGRPSFLRLLREEPAIGLGVARALVATVRDIQGAGRPSAVDTSRGETPDEDLSRDAALVAQGSRAAAVPLLASLPVFAEVSKRHLRKIARLAELKSHAGGSAVVRAGGRGDAFYVIVDGRCEAVTPEMRTYGLAKGDSFGELSLLDGAPRAATVSAVGELTVLRIPRPAFLRLMGDEPAMTVAVVRGLVALIRRLQQEEAL